MNGPTKTENLILETTCEQLRKEAEQLRKENEELRGRLVKKHLPEEYESWEQVWKRQRDTLKERDQLKLHVQVLREALIELWDFTGESHISNCSINDPSEPSCDCGHEQIYRRLENVIPNALSTTPSLNDYVPRSVADELINYVRHYNCCPAPIDNCSCSCGLTQALTAYQSTQKEQTK